MEQRFSQVVRESRHKPKSRTKNSKKNHRELDAKDWNPRDRNIFQTRSRPYNISKALPEPFFYRLRNEGHRKEAHRMGNSCLLYTSPSPRDRQKSRMPS